MSYDKFMILSDPTASMRLPDYGIQIPVLDSRVSNTLEYLRRRGCLSQDVLVNTITSRFEAEDLLRVHDGSYVQRLYGDGLESEILSTFELIDEFGNPYRYTPESASRPLRDLFSTVLKNASGTFDACNIALDTGFCYYLGGGFHHGHYDHGSGFCLINDIVISARKLIHERRAKNVWVIDIDAHKGDGTAALCEKDPNILTLSIHMGEGWPLDYDTLCKCGPKNPALTPSDVEIPIMAHRNEYYLPELKIGLEKLAELDKGAQLNTAYGTNDWSFETEPHPVKPDLAIVVDGSDPYEKDELPSSAGLHLTLAEMIERDQLVLNFLRSRGIPSVWLMAGGYGRFSWEVYSHFLETVLS